MKEMGFNLNKMELRDAIKLRYDCLIDDIPCTCVCGEAFSVDHAMICKRGGFVIQLHNGLHDIEAELLSLVCNDVQTEPILQDITGEQLSRGTNKVLEARLDTHARGFWGRQRSTFFDVRVCYPNVDLNLNRSANCTKTRRSVYMRTELLKLNVIRLHHWSSPQREVWEKNATDTIAG